MKTKNKITIIQDTREQKPLDFSQFENVEVVVDTCWPGDYTIRGWEKSIAFERKSVSDLIGTMLNGYVGKDSIRRYENRFDLELEEFERHYDRAFIIVEPDEPATIHEIADRYHSFKRPTYEMPAGEQIACGLYRAAVSPDKIFSFIRALTVEYGCHVYLAASREDAANEIVEIARKYVHARRHVIHREKVRKENGKQETAQDPW